MSLCEVLARLENDGVVLPKTVKKRDGGFVEFNPEKIVDAIYAAAKSAGGHDKQKAEEVAYYSIKLLFDKGKSVPSVDEINQVNIESLKELGYDGTAHIYKKYSEERKLVREKLRIYGGKDRKDNTDGILMVASSSDEVAHPWNRRKIETSLIEEAYVSPDIAKRVAKKVENKIVLTIDLENNKRPILTTNLIREMAYLEMLDLGLRKEADRYRNFTIPKANLESILFSKHKENSNIAANNPEAVNFTLSEMISKEYALTSILSQDIAEAHTNGEIHIHDLGMAWRVYCSSHSLEYLKKYGLNLINLQTGSSPSKHTKTLTGHLNTFLASMQTYYAGALGVGYLNIFYAPLIEKDIEEIGEAKIIFHELELIREKEKMENLIKNRCKKYLESGTKEILEGLVTSKIQKPLKLSELTDQEFDELLEKEINEEIEKSSVHLEQEMLLIAEECNKDRRERLNDLKLYPLDSLTDSEIEKFIKQEMQYLIFSGSQNAFSRGGQTLFLDFNIHTGIPNYLKETLAIGPSGKYMLKRDDKIIFLEERKLDKKTPSGYHLTELVDPTIGNVIMREELKIIMKQELEEGKVVPKTEYDIVQNKLLKDNEKLVSYGDYDKLAKKIAKVALEVWKEGDKNGVPFAFPKCDFHVSEDTFNDPEQLQLLKYACEIASENGSPYFVFDRDEVTLAACCRLRTAITDNYVLKHPESMRFCGFQNVTINLPQAAYRAERKGKKNIEGLLEEIDQSMNLALKAHLEKKKFIRKLQEPGSPQWQTGKPSEDGLPYIDLNKTTYIIGLIGLNEAVQYVLGKELHELNSEEFEKYALRTIAHMNIKTKEFGEKYKLKFSLEETPAESTARRLAKIDLEKYPESRKVVKGDIENDAPYYTNSIHFRADAPIDLVTRIRQQSKYHHMIESGAIIHAFVGENKPSPESLINLIKKVYDNTQCAQFVVSPEFTVCNQCSYTDRGLKDNCSECGSKDVDGITRIVGYFSKVSNWNKSKLGELEDRHKGDYSVH